MTQQTSDYSRFWELIKDIRFGMLTAPHPDGGLRSRPMTTQNGKDDRAGTLWFFAARHGEAALAVDGVQVHVGYADTGKDAYVSVAGRARIVEDAAKRRALWGTMTQAWFPGGPDDPEVALVAVDIEHAEYWDVKNSHLVQLIKMATAAATGRKPNLKAEHGEIGRR
jgi:general stress protein 26